MRMVCAEQVFQKAMNDFDKHANEEIKKDADYIVNVRPYELNGFAIFQEALASTDAAFDPDAMITEIKKLKIQPVLFNDHCGYNNAIDAVLNIIEKHIYEHFEENDQQSESEDEKDEL